MDDMDDFVSCPYCGNNDFSLSDNGATRYTFCNICGARGPMCNTNPMLYDVSNHRPAEDALRAQLDEMTADRDSERRWANHYHEQAEALTLQLADRDAEIARLREDNERMEASIHNTLYVDAVRYENDTVPKIIRPLVQENWRLHDEIARLREVIDAVEWVTEGEEWSHCPWCDGLEPLNYAGANKEFLARVNEGRGHAPDCPRQLALASGVTDNVTDGEDGNNGKV